MTNPAPLPFAVVLNPAAGNGLAARKWPELRAELERRGLAFGVLETESAAQALAQVEALPPEQPLLVVGGDGTMVALLPALVGTRRAAALVPYGSGNDFAGMLGLRAGDTAAALDTIRPAPYRVDALQVDVLEGDYAGLQRPILNGLGMGIDAQITHAYLRAPKRLPGFWRYAWGAASSLGRPKLAGLSVRLGGQEVYRGLSALTAVMNSTRYGGGFLISPRSDPRDGLLNVVASGPMGGLALASLMLKVLPGKHLGHPLVHDWAAQEVEVRWDESMYLHLDGDLCGRVQHLRARVLPRAVGLLNGSGGQKKG